MSISFIKRARFMPVAAGCAAVFALGMTSTAQEADPSTPTQTGLPIVLENGLLMSAGNGASILHTLNVNGIYYVSGKPAGGWVLRDDALCLVSIPGKVNCTALPENISPGASWNTSHDDGTSTSYALPGGSASAEADEDNED